MAVRAHDCVHWAEKPPRSAMLAALRRARDLRMDQHIINLYDRFTHGGMSRRAFLDRLVELTGSAAAAPPGFPPLQSHPAKAPHVCPAEPPPAAATRAC